MSAGGVVAARSDDHRAGGGATPTPALHSILVKPIPQVLARELLVRKHYLRSLPGGTRLSFGLFLGSRLKGALTLGVGPLNSHALVRGAAPDDCLVLTRLWLSDDLPPNSESRCMAVVLREMRKHTVLKFLVSYADPAQGHLGVIYQASNWLYTGRSSAVPLYDLGDGIPRHSRSLSHAFGTHSLKHFRSKGVDVQLVPQESKHRYVYFLDRSWRDRLAVPVLPYPKSIDVSEPPLGVSDDQDC